MGLLKPLGSPNAYPIYIIDSNSGSNSHRPVKESLLHPVVSKVSLYRYTVQHKAHTHTHTSYRHEIAPCSKAAVTKVQTSNSAHIKPCQPERTGAFRQHSKHLVSKPVCLASFLFSTSLIFPWQTEALTLCNVLTGHSDKSSHLMRECHLLASTISSSSCL